MPLRGDQLSVAKQQLGPTSLAQGAFSLEGAFELSKLKRNAALNSKTSAQPRSIASLAEEENHSTLIRSTRSVPAHFVASKTEGREDFWRVHLGEACQDAMDDNVDQFYLGEPRQV